MGLYLNAGTIVLSALCPGCDQGVCTELQGSETPKCECNEGYQGKNCDERDAGMSVQLLYIVPTICVQCIVHRVEMSKLSHIKEHSRQIG